MTLPDVVMAAGCALNLHLSAMRTVRLYVISKGHFCVDRDLPILGVKAAGWLMTLTQPQW